MTGRGKGNEGKNYIAVLRKCAKNIGDTPPFTSPFLPSFPPLPFSPLLFPPLQAGLTSGPTASSTDPFAGDDVAAAFGDELKEPAIEDSGDAKESSSASNDPWSSAFTGSALLGGDGDAWGGGLDAAEFGIETGGMGRQEEDSLVGLADKGPVMGPIAAAMAAGDVAGRQLEAALGLGGPDAGPAGAAAAPGE